MERPDIPNDTERKVRQKCGFGCIFCRCPIYEIHHIDDYAKTHLDDADNLVLLCSHHHTKKTKGLISAEAIIKAIKRFELSAFTAKEPLEMESFRLILGNNVFHHCPGYTFNILGRHYFRLSYDSGFIIDCCIGAPDGSPALLIEQGQLSLSTGVWDITWVGKTITLRSGPRNPFLNVTLDAEGKEIIIKGSLALDDGSRIEITNSGILYAGHTLFSQCDFKFAGGIGLLVYADEADLVGKTIAFRDCTARRCSGIDVGGFALSSEYMRAMAAGEVPIRP